MSIGPVEYLVVAFPGNQFKGEIAPALRDLIDRGVIRVLDLVFIMKDAEGDVSAVEVDEHEQLAAFFELEGEIGGLVGEADILYAAEALPPESSAALIVWEDLWATPLVEAMRAAGGELVEGSRIPADLLEQALSELQPVR